MEKNGS